jgi:alanine racemase
MFRKTYAEINLDALENNIFQIQGQLSPGGFFCPMVKANAYGHGDVTVARALEMMGVRALGVCLIEEGLLLRQFGVKAQILVFRGFDLEGARQILAHELTPVVSHWSHLEFLDQVSEGPCVIHLKFDTGMNRLGFDLSEAEKVFEFLRSRKKFQVEGVLTHLFQGEDGLDPEGHSSDQLRRLSPLQEIFKTYQPQFHALNSAGFIAQGISRRRSLKQLGTEVESDPWNRKAWIEKPWGVRPGLMIYGYSPLVDIKSEDQLFDLKPVMTLKSVVSVFRSVSQGQGVSYNHSWKAKRDSQIAIVPMGYADGFHRILSNNFQVLFRGRRVPIVGNICMDFLMLDVTDVLSGLAKPAALVDNSEVVFFGLDSGGQFLSAMELAQAAGTITWEVLTSVGERVPRVYCSSQSKYQRLL